MDNVYARNVEVAGTYFKFKAALDFAQAPDPKEIELVLEPTNRYDDNAIAVLHGKRPIGYVPAHLAKRIAEEQLRHRIIGCHYRSYVTKNDKIVILFDIILAKEAVKSVSENGFVGREVT